MPAKPLRYPIGEHQPGLLKSPSGVPFTGITLDALLENRIGMEDLRITSEALELQAQIAEANTRPQLAESLRRAAELVPVPDAKVLEIYEALRPGRSTRASLHRLAEELETAFRAPRTAAFVRAAADATMGD